MIEDNGGLHALAAAFELANIKDNQCIRISAEQQRRLFGKAVIGKKAIRFINGGFQVVWGTAFGQDWEVNELREFLK